MVLRCQLQAMFEGGGCQRDWLDASTVSLYSPNGRQISAVRAMLGACQWLLKTVEIFADLVGHQNCGLPRNQQNMRNLTIYIPGSQSKNIYHYWITRYGPYPTDSPIADKLGLGSSLVNDRHQQMYSAGTLKPENSSPWNEVKKQQTEIYRRYLWLVVIRVNAKGPVK